MNKVTIPVYQPTLDGNEKKYVLECLETTWISSRGKFIDAFEKKFAEFLGVPAATTVNNGTVALHLAFLALNIGAGDEVIVPTFTYIASVNAINYVGAKPVFVDAEPTTWNIDVSKIEEKITPKTKAVMAVHLYGAPCDMDALVALCKKHKLLLVEDVAEAFGTKFKGKYAGSFGDVSTFSFFGNKTITTGEGGMIVSHDPEIVKRIAFLKSQAVSQTKEYWHDEVGYNYRMTNICAAIGLAQLERAHATIEAKRRLASWYREELKGLPLEFQPEAPGTTHSYWMVSLLAKDEDTRNKIRLGLKNAGIETRPLFYPAHTMPVFRENKSYPVAENISCRGLNLPSFHSLSREQVNFICSEVRKVLSV